ncbi:MAG: DUF6599 family protein [Acidobacteriota bacterium]
MIRPGFVLLVLFCPALLPGPAASQTTFIPASYFPAEFEFRELSRITSDQRLEQESQIESLQEGPLLLECGAVACETRAYALEDGSSFTIRIVTLEDSRGAYALLTLLGGGEARRGPPGDAFAAADGALTFAQSRYWVRILPDQPGDLSRRVAVSIGNRIGELAESLPALIQHFPTEGLDPSSLRYCMGRRAAATFLKPIRGRQLDLEVPFESAQARYELGAQTGYLTLVSMPTVQMAEEYFDTRIAGLAGDTPGGPGLFASRAGPIISILEGTFEPARADKLLGSLEYTYTVQWIFDKNRRPVLSLWDMPFGMMNTVVRSIVLVSLLCLLSIVAGVALAVFRLALRAYAPNNIFDRPERTELIRLRINED